MRSLLFIFIYINNDTILAKKKLTDDKNYRKRGLWIIINFLGHTGHKNDTDRTRANTAKNNH